MATTLSVDTDRHRYGTLAIGFHWLIAALLLVQVPLAWIMTDLPLGPDKLGTYAFHKSLGMTIFAITALRLAWRLVRPAPVVPGVPLWQRVLARLTQGFLYFLLFALPVTGWMMSSAANVPVSVFGWFTLPDLVVPDEAKAKVYENIHEAQGNFLLWLVGLHALAAAWHHFVRRDKVLAAMLPRGVRR